MSYKVEIYKLLPLSVANIGVLQKQHFHSKVKKVHHYAMSSQTEVRLETDVIIVPPYKSQANRCPRLLLHHKCKKFVSVREVVKVCLPELPVFLRCLGQMLLGLQGPDPTHPGNSHSWACRTGPMIGLQPRFPHLQRHVQKSGHTYCVSAPQLRVRVHTRETQAEAVPGLQQPYTCHEIPRREPRIPLFAFVP